MDVFLTIVACCLASLIAHFILVYIIYHHFIKDLHKISSNIIIVCYMCYLAFL